MRSLVFVMVGLAACGEDSSGGPYVPLDALVSSYKDAQCKHLVACGSFPDQATCVAAAVNSNFLIDPNTVAAVHAGKAYYDGGKAAACFDALAMQTCDRTDRDGRIPPPSCSGIFRGGLHSGETCALDSECISQTCSTNCFPNAQTCCSGTCVGDAPPIVVDVPLGGACNLASHVCTAGTYCNNTGTCVALKTTGTTCTTPNECDFGLFCTGGTTATCKALPALGQPCPDFQCRDEGQICSNTTQTCVALGLPGSPCNSNAQCSSFYRCDTSATCTAYPKLGESCATAFRCNDTNTYCQSSQPQLCAATKPDGAPCGSSSECAGGYCDTTTAACTTFPTCI